MATENVSTSPSLEEEFFSEARSQQRDRIAALLTELDSEFGPVDPRVVEEVRKAWPAPTIQRGALGTPRSRQSGAAKPPADLSLLD